MQVEMPTNTKQKKRNWSPWMASLLVHAVLIGSLVLVHTAERPAVAARDSIVTPLVYWPTPKIRQVVISVPRPKFVVPTPAVPVQLKVPTPALPARQFNAFIREQPKAVSLQAPEPTAQQQAPLTPVKVSASALPPNPAMAVKTDVFGSSGNSPAGHTPSPRLEVHTGGFGSIDGTQVSAGKGNPNGVRVGGFGDTNGQPGGSASSASRTIADAGFGNAAAPPPPAMRKAEATIPPEMPVEVLWKPKPVYTEEARAKKIEGDVAVEVVFHASGQIEVVGVTRGLGYGLDQSAKAAAQQIRFRPGRKDGVPVDRTGLVLITFEIS